MIKTFWGRVIGPGESVEIECPDDVYTILTGACLGEIPDGKSGQTVLKAKVKRVLWDDAIESTELDPVQIDECIFAVLIPGKIEFIKLSHQFSPLNSLHLIVEGDFDVHVSGIYRPLPIDVEEEEEEEEEELTEQQLQAKLEKYIRPAK
jgi:hypothetical protein